MYVCICLVARINQRVFRNSSLQMFSMHVLRRAASRKATGGPPQELAAKQLVYNKNYFKQPLIKSTVKLVPYRKKYWREKYLAK